jgi:hypothetical protein
VLMHQLLQNRDQLLSLSSDPGNAAIRKVPAVVAAVNRLRGIFSSACSGDPIDHPAISAASDAVVGQLEARGLDAWIDVVRTHHSQTYQHCLLVTGLAVAFGQQAACRMRTGDGCPSPPCCMTSARPESRWPS